MTRLTILTHVILRIGYVPVCLFIILSTTDIFAFEKCKKNNIYVSVMKSYSYGVDEYVYITSDSVYNISVSHKYTINLYKQDALSRVKHVLQSLVEDSFFQLDDFYGTPEGNDGIEYEDIFYDISLSVGGRCKSVVAHELNLPVQVRSLIESVTSIVSRLPDSEKYGYFVKASRMKPRKAGDEVMLTKRDVDLTIKKNRPSYHGDGDFLDRYPIIDRVIKEKERFFHLGESPAQAIMSDLFKSEREIYIDKDNGDTYLVRIYTREKPKAL